MADFIGEANIVECEITSVKNGVADVKLGDYKLQLPARDSQVGVSLLGVRPNRILVGKPKAANSLPGEVLRVTYVDNHLELTIKTKVGDLFATTDDVDAPLQIGTAVSVTFVQNASVLLKD